jgi:hypothetical protein
MTIHRELVVVPSRKKTDMVRCPKHSLLPEMFGNIYIGNFWLRLWHWGPVQGLQELAKCRYLSDLYHHVHIIG